MTKVSRKRTTIDIDVWNIEVSDFHYEFEYEVFVNGEKKDGGIYASDNLWLTDRVSFKEHLEESGAVQDIMDSMSNELWT
jgi:hypothetical protein